MAGIITIAETKNWSAANWAYWSLMDYMIELVASDAKMARRLEGYKWMQSLSFPMIREENPDLARKILGMLKTVAERCAIGDLICKVEGKPLDEASQKQFQNCMKNLVDILDDEIGSFDGE